MAKIYWAGDSTAANYSYIDYPQTGIGQVFSCFLKKEYGVENFALCGASTKSFIDKGLLKEIGEKITEGDYLFIQFGHNDEKIEDPARYTDPYDSFIDNLQIFIDTARKHGAYPVLITPVERRCFVDDKQLGPGGHVDYAAGMKQAAEKFHVPLVDLYTLSRTELERVGEEESRKWYMFFPENSYSNRPEEYRDNTHLRHEGAVHFASLIAKGIKQLESLYSDMLLEGVRL